MRVYRQGGSFWLGHPGRPHEFRHRRGQRPRECWCGTLELGIWGPIPAKAAHKRRYGR